MSDQQPTRHPPEVIAAARKLAIDALDYDETEAAIAMFREMRKAPEETVLEVIARILFNALACAEQDIKNCREKSEAELKAYSDAVDAQPWATDEPIRVMLDRVTERMQKAERELAEARKALADMAKIAELMSDLLATARCDDDEHTILITRHGEIESKHKEAIDAAREAGKGGA